LNTELATPPDDETIRLYNLILHGQTPLPPATAAATPTTTSVLPPLPPLVIGRDGALKEIKGRLGIGGADMRPTTVIQGWPGVGKSSIVALLAHDRDVAQRFPDGILWASLGENPSMLSQIAAWAEALSLSEPGRTGTIEEISAQLTAVLRDKRMLLIVDDVWRAEHATPFRVGGQMCAMVVTTRLNDIAISIAPTASDMYRLPVLTDRAAFELLSQLTPETTREHPTEARDLARNLEGLPLAITVAGRLLHSEARLGWGVRELLIELGMGSSLLRALPPSDMLGEAANDPLSMERAFFGLAAYSEERGKYAEAEHYLKRALHLALKLGIAVETGRILNALGSVAGCVGEYQKSYRYYAQYLELVEAHGEKSKVCHALLSLGEGLISLKAYAEAERYLQRAVSMCRALGFLRFLGVGLLNLGTLAIEQGRLEVARLYLLEGLRAVRAVGVQRQIVLGLTTLGYTQLRLGDSAGALEYLHEGLEMAREGGRPRNICDAQMYLADTYLAMQNLEDARSALHESLTIAQSLNSHPQKVRALSTVVAYYQCRGQQERAASVAGIIVGEPLIDETRFTSACAQLEAALGSEGYQKALAQGKTRNLDEAVAEEVLALV
jgi:tetratricopeptide (TPR) repeat protein